MDHKQGEAPSPPRRKSVKVERAELVRTDACQDEERSTARAVVAVLLGRQPIQKRHRANRS